MLGFDLEDSLKEPEDERKLTKKSFWWISWLLIFAIISIVLSVIPNSDAYDETFVIFILLILLKYFSKFGF
jgi:hypothetical protein